MEGRHEGEIASISSPATACRVWCGAAVADDAEQLLAGVRAVIGEQLEGVISQPGEMAVTVDQERTWIEGSAETDNSILLIAEHDGALVGWLDLRERPPAHGASRSDLWHQRERRQPWRHRGVGTALIQTMLDWATRNPLIDKVKLGVVAQNQGARRLYERLGFVEEGYQRREYKRRDGTYLDNVLMCRFVKDPDPGSRSLPSQSDAPIIGTGPFDRRGAVPHSFSVVVVDRSSFSTLVPASVR